MFKLIVSNTKGDWVKEETDKAKALKLFKAVKKTGNVSLFEIIGGKEYLIKKARAS